MIRNYFKTALRNIAKHKTLSFINISGLSIGLACVMLIMLFVNDEYSFDRFQEKGDRIARLTQTFTDTSGQQFRQGNSPVPAGPAYTAAIPEIEAFCRLKGWSMTVKKGTEGIESRVLMVDTSFFNVFSFTIKKGNPAHVLDGRNSVVLSKKAARFYFGQDDPIGKTVEIEVDEDFEPFVVSGVVNDPPLNSSIQFDMLIPFERQFPLDAKERNEMQTDWSSLYINTFVLLRKDANMQQTAAKLETVYRQYNKDAWKQQQQQQGANSRLQHFLQPFYTMHLDDQFFASNGLQNWSDSFYSYVLSGLAILLLVIACINFINITLARSIRRNKEVGIRKVSGSTRRQLVMQFLSESAIVTAFAFLPALGMVQLSLPLFSELAEKHMDITFLFQWRIVLLFASLWLVVSILAGAYPAFVASGFKPVATLYGKFKLSNRNVLGKSLVVLQFAIALALIISMVVFQRQFHYMTTQADLGFRTDDRLRIQFPPGHPSEAKIFRQQLLQSPSILQVGAKAGDQNKSKFVVNNKETDWTYYEQMNDQYLQTLDIPLIKGRYLSYNNTADSVSNCLVNQSFADELLGKGIDPIGQVVSRPGNKASFTIVGVVKNYHLANFKEKIQPVIFLLDKRGSTFNNFIHYQPGQGKTALAAAQKAFKALLPYASFDYSYMDDWNRHRYESEQRWKDIITYSALLAILISCLGLFALATLSVEQRIKEIGIRKVLGASVVNITTMLSKEFMILVGIAFLIAAPVAGWFTWNWLQDFAYRISFSAWIFIGTGALVLLVALCTISINTIRAALSNPVKSLRSE